MHRLPDQIPHQTGSRLPPGAHRHPAGPHRPAGRGAAVRAVLAAVRELAPLRHPAQERPARPAARARARARPTAASTSATPGAASWSPANGPARPSLTTAPTARTGSWPPSARPPPTRPATPGNPSHPATPTTWNTPGASCTSSPTASNGTPHSPKPDAERAHRKTVRYRKGGQREGQANAGQACPSRGHPDDRRSRCAPSSGECRADTSDRWREIGLDPKCLKIPNGELRAWRGDFSAWLETSVTVPHEVASSPFLGDPAQQDREDRDVRGAVDGPGREKSTTLARKDPAERYRSRLIQAATGARRSTCRLRPA